MRLLLLALCIAGVKGDCGEVKVNNPAGLVHGSGTQSTQHGDWPWLVPLFNIHGTADYGFFCGSSLISPWHLLTGESSLLSLACFH
jgi:hypothetical protein